MLQKLRRIQFLLMAGLATSLPFSIDNVKITSLFVILLAVNAIPLYFLTRPVATTRVEKVAVSLFVLFYIIHFLGLIATANSHQGFFELEKKLALLVFPLLFVFTPRLELLALRRVLTLFVGSCSLSLLFCLFVAIHGFRETGDTSRFFYHTLSEPVGMHAAYLSMYFCFAIFILLVGGDSMLDRSVKGFRLAVIVSLAGGVLLLSARTQILILSAGMSYWLAFKIKNRYGLWKAGTLAMLFGVSVLGIALLFPVNRDRFMRAINFGQRYGLDKEWGEQQIRALIWECSGQIIAENAWTGVGTGDGEDELQACYRRNEFNSLTYFKNATFNAHNQFLETTIQLGIGGVIIFLGGICFACLHAYRDGNHVFLILILIFAASCMTESMLESQSGIIFFAFFNSFLFINHLPIVTQRKTELESRQKQTV
jgi:O-antigen ligase